MSGNPFQAFAFHARSAPSPCKPQNSVPLKAARDSTSSPVTGLTQQAHAVTGHSQTSSRADGGGDGSRQTLSSCQPQQQSAPETQKAVWARHSPSKTRKRKLHASLTGPPKGLGPKLGTSSLRLILVGHNPSEHAFHTGHFYSNPSNRMWPILISTGIAPPGTTGPEADDTMPAAVGVGFIDVGSGQPGTDSSLFTSKDFQQWRDGFYERLQQHVQAASASIGKRQYVELLNIDEGGQVQARSRQKSAAVQLGKQPPESLPPGWPLPCDKTEVWVLTSTSGAAPMTKADRERPYRQLAERLQQVPWPRSDIPLACCT